MVNPKIITSAYAQNNPDEIIQQILNGAILICPTDTIYGLSCDATNENSVKKIRSIKQRDEKPLSVWVPSKDWIKKHCEVNEEHLSKLPGPYILIVKLKNRDILTPSVLQNSPYLGLRIPNHWLSSIVEQLNRPIITTSVNLSGENPATSIQKIPQRIIGQINLIIDEGEKSNNPSTIINTLTNEQIERQQQRDSTKTKTNTYLK